MNMASISILKAAQDQLVEQLASVLARWQETGIEPGIIGVFSSGERAAIYIAAGKEKLLDSPLSSFLILEDSLQRWVLRERGMSNFIGATIAGQGL